MVTGAAQSRGRPENLRFCTRKFVEIHVPESRNAVKIETLFLKRIAVIPIVYLQQKPNHDYLLNRRGGCRQRRCTSALLALSSDAWASRTITDQIGREVTIPDTVNRVAVLQHQTLTFRAAQRPATRSGVLASWKKQLARIRALPAEPEDDADANLTSASVESLLELKPDVVFVANYAPKDMIDKIQGAGIPVVAASLRRDAARRRTR